MYELTLETTSVRIYFISFYYLGVIIGVNIILAFAIDIYSAIQRIEKKTTENAHLLDLQVKMAAKRF
jgi:hypothetical protein